jgi:hypothetical protein
MSVEKRKFDAGERNPYAIIAGHGKLLVLIQKGKRGTMKQLECKSA